MIYRLISHQRYEPATLFTIGMPIGNMGDVTLRALHLLSICDRIAAEDTRHSRILLNRYQISKPMIALHEHNEEENAERLISYLSCGERIALITDAGTPGISDPGGLVVSMARRSGFAVVPIPGASAVIVAMSLVGNWGKSFTFHGFLPRKSNERITFLNSIRSHKFSHVFYEAPHRIILSLRDCLECLGGSRRAMIAKELTKIHETTICGTLDEVFNRLQEKKLRGEFVIVIEGLGDDSLFGDRAEINENLLKVLLKELPLSQAVRLVCQITGEDKNEVYKKALHLRHEVFEK